MTKTTKKTAAKTAKSAKPAPKAEATKPATKKAKGEAQKKLSALDAAAKVLEASKEPLNAKQMIDAMSSKGLWSSPGGKTPHATLYSAILREITVKGKESRFKKTDRGHFAING